MRTRIAVSVVSVALAFVAGQDGAKAGSGVATFYATVNGAGTVINSSGVHAISHPSDGVYTITFNRPNTGCGYLAAVTGVGIGYAVVERVDATAFTVRTYNSSATLADRQFNIIVSCAN